MATSSTATERYQAYNHLIGHSGGLTSDQEADVLGRKILSGTVGGGLGYLVGLGILLLPVELPALAVLGVATAGGVVFGVATSGAEEIPPGQQGIIMPIPTSSFFPYPTAPLAPACSFPMDQNTPLNAFPTGGGGLFQAALAALDKTDPLLLDLNGDGIQTTNYQNAVLFDQNNTGFSMITITDWGRYLDPLGVEVGRF